MSKTSGVYHTTLRETDVGRKLAKSLSNIAKYTRDFPYENQPYQNVIDPDLHALKYDEEIDDPTDMAALQTKYDDKEYVMWPAACSWFGYQTDCTKMKEKTQRVPDPGYRMCPCVIQVSVNPQAIHTKISNDKGKEYTYDKFDPKSYKVVFLSQIFGIPYTFHRHSTNSKIYTYFSVLLQQMYPYIQRVLGLSDLQLFEQKNTDSCGGSEVNLTSTTQRLEIIVKAQMYLIETEKIFQGQWHTDGALERVKCICVWYYQIDKEMTGGELIFRTMTGDNFDISTTESTFDLKSDVIESKTVTHSFNDNHRHNEYYLSIKQNDMVIWNQYDIIHCVGDISIGMNKNLSKEAILKQPKKMYTRAFLNIFVIDAAYPSPRTSLTTADPCDFSKNNREKRYLIKAIWDIIGETYKCLNGLIPLEIVNMIYQFAFYPLRTFKQSVDVRNHIAKNRNEKGDVQEFYNGNESVYLLIWDWQPYEYD